MGVIDVETTTEMVEVLVRIEIIMEETVHALIRPHPSIYVLKLVVGGVLFYSIADCSLTGD